MATFYVTTPIYYVNDLPHMGHAYTTIMADVAARWHRLRGDDVRFLTGTDEHGQKVLRAAEKAGRTPQEHADLLHQRFKALWVALDVEPDDFIRTTEPRHQEVVAALLMRLHARGELYAADYSGWYSTSAERFWTEEEVAAASGGTPEDLRAGRVPAVCPDSGTAVEWVTEKNWFFRMSAYQQRLIDHIHAWPASIQPESRRNEVLGYLRKPLGDLCISRPKARLPWGIPLPFDSEYVTYVWFDALTNYISALGGDSTEQFARYWPSTTHLVGKDIITFHTVYWFSMLFAAGIAPPRQVLAHGWLLKDRVKMSKSIGNVARVEDYLPTFGPDAIRYFLLRELSFGQDGEWSDDAVLVRYNADLANDLGNLAHRALTMTEKWLGGVLPPPGPVTGGDPALLTIAQRATDGYAAGLDTFAFRTGIESLWELVRAGNKYVDTEAPWALNKNGQMVRLGTVLRNCLEVCRIVASHLTPVMPGKMGELLSRIGLVDPDLTVSFDRIRAGTVVAARDPLFPRLESVMSEPLPAAPPVELPTAAPLPPEVTYDDFAKLALRTGLVLAAEKHPNADKLLVLTVDVGEAAPRTIVAGIAAVYAPDAIVGRTIVVVANLKPVKLRGVMSQGMLLAAGGPDVAALLAPIAAVPPGTVVK